MRCCALRITTTGCVRAVLSSARLDNNAPAGSFITNRAQIFGREAEEPGKTNDNYSTWRTLVSAGNTNSCVPCSVGYPYASTNPLTSVVFNESEILRAYNTNVTGIADTIRLWYNDEHALALGVRRVNVKTLSGSLRSCAGAHRRARTA